jgi:hypothetical protein
MAGKAKAPRVVEPEPQQLPQPDASVTGWLVRENKGWVFVTKDDVPPELVEAIAAGWKRVSDLPIIVFGTSELFTPGDGSIQVKEVTLAS